MADIYFNPQYAKIYESTEGKSDTFVFECKYGKIQNTFILREVKWKLDGKTYYDIVTPYGYGGPLILACTNIVPLIEEYKVAFTEYCYSRNIICEFIRFHLFENTDFREHYYGESVKKSDNVVVDTTDTYDKIYMNYQHKVRKNIKKAERNGLEVKSEANINNLDDFINIYHDTMRRNNASSYYYFPKKYFEELASRLPDNYKYFHVVKDQKIVATELVLCSKDYAYSFLGGTASAFYEMRPNDLLKDAVIKWCIDTSRKAFILGGGFHDKDGIYQYKKSFSKTPDVPFYVGKYIFDEKKYEELLVMSGACLDSDFFPKYRA